MDRLIVKGRPPLTFIYNKDKPQLNIKDLRDLMGFSITRKTENDHSGNFLSQFLSKKGPTYFSPRELDEFLFEISAKKRIIQEILSDL